MKPLTKYLRIVSSCWLNLDSRDGQDKQRTPPEKEVSSILSIQPFLCSSSRARYSRMIILTKALLEIC